MPIQHVDLSISAPFGLGSISGRWAPGDLERTAAWEMYVELVTRISVEELRPEEGLLDETLTSLYSLFATTRGILRKHGPALAKPGRGGSQSFGSIAVAILNRVLRPLLATWHPLLVDHEAARPPGVSKLAHERSWQRAPELRAAIDEVREALTEYADVLARVADVPPIHGDRAPGGQAG